MTAQSARGAEWRQMAENNVYEPEEEMTVTLSLEDGRDVECIVVTIFECKDKQYIALLPKDEDGEPTDEVFLYGYKEQKDGEPELINIEDDDEYEAVADKFDELLDSMEYDELVEDGEVEE